jgi:hypothetical protein
MAHHLPPNDGGALAAEFGRWRGSWPERGEPAAHAHAGRGWRTTVLTRPQDMPRAVPPIHTLLVAAALLVPGAALLAHARASA